MRLFSKVLGVLVLILAITATYYTAYSNFQSTTGLFGKTIEPTYVTGVISIVAFTAFILSNAWIINKKSLVKKSKMVYIFSLLIISCILVVEIFRTF